MYFPDEKTFSESKYILKNIVCLFYLSGFLIIYLLPEKILTYSEILEHICNSISTYIPSIDKWSSHSPFPETTKVFFSYCWLSTPFQLMAIIKDKRLEEGFLKKWRENTSINYLRLIVLIIFTCLLIFLTGYFAIVDSKPCFICVNNSKFSQALIGGLIPFVNAGMLAVGFWVLKNRKHIFK